MYVELNVVLYSYSILTHFSGVLVVDLAIFIGVLKVHDLIINVLAITTVSIVILIEKIESKKI